MTPEEVKRFFEQLREAAEDLSAVRNTIAKFKVKKHPGMYGKGWVLSEVRTGKVDIEKDLAHIEAQLREALEPIGTSTLDDV